LVREKSEGRIKEGLAGSKASKPEKITALPVLPKTESNVGFAAADAGRQQLFKTAIRIKLSGGKPTTRLRGIGVKVFYWQNRRRPQVMPYGTLTPAP
jgi:hypothetical protein